MSNNSLPLAERMNLAADDTYDIVSMRQAALKAANVCKAFELNNSDEVQHIQRTMGEILLAKSISPEKALNAFCSPENLPIVNSLDLGMVDVRRPVFNNPDVLRDNVNMQERLLGAFRHENIGYKGDLSKRDSMSVTAIWCRLQGKDNDIYELTRQRVLLEHKIGSFTVALKKMTWFLMSEGLVSEIIAPPDVLQKKPHLNRKQTKNLHAMLDSNEFPDDPDKLIKGVASVYYVRSKSASIKSDMYD